MSKSNNNSFPAAIGPLNPPPLRAYGMTGIAYDPIPEIIIANLEAANKGEKTLMVAGADYNGFFKQKVVELMTNYKSYANANNIIGYEIKSKYSEYLDWFEKILVIA